jgi:hypothetical protein
MTLPIPIRRDLFAPALAAAFCLLGALPADAQTLRLNPRAVVELFTSQGCSSCPPADALLTELSGRDDIVALAYHVDYWDYIGWADTFGAEDNSERQRAYAARWGSSRIYTPQMVINGQKDVVASRQGEVWKALEHSELLLPVTLSASNDMITISLDGREGHEAAMIWLVTYRDAAEVAIERGENGGKSILYSHIVTGRQPLGVWDPDTGAEIRMPLAEVLSSQSNGVAVIVQEEHDGLPGAIIGAALYEQ